jgi:class 3 adenylate cyclase
MFGSLLEGLNATFWFFVPLRLKVLVGWGGASWDRIQYAHIDRNRIASEPFHSLTLEFESAMMEKSYQIDFALRSYKQPIFYLLLLIVPFMISFIRFQIDKREIDTSNIDFLHYFILDPLVVLPFASIFQILFYLFNRRNENYLVASFSTIQFFLAATSLSLMTFWMYYCPFRFGTQTDNPTDFQFNLRYEWPFEEAMLVAMIFGTVNGLLRISWTQVVQLGILTILYVLSFRWMATGTYQHETSCWFRKPQEIAVFVTLASAITGHIQYTLEKLSRVNFVLSFSLIKESDRTEQLLNNVLPPVVAEKLKILQSTDTDVDEKGLADSTNPSTPQPRHASSGQSSGEILLAERHEEATIVYIDVVGFTPMCSTMDAVSLVRLLNSLFTAFDFIAQEEGLEKIKTVGDAYIAAAGVPEPNEYHAAAACRFALRIVKCVENITSFERPISVRVGISSGPLIAGIIGSKRIQYELWGRCVDRAKDLQQIAGINKVRICAATFSYVEEIFEIANDQDNTYILTDELRNGSNLDFRTQTSTRRTRRRRSSSVIVNEIS